MTRCDEACDNCDNCDGAQQCSEIMCREITAEYQNPSSLLKMGGLIRARKLKYLEYDGDNRLVTTETRPPSQHHSGYFNYVLLRPDTLTTALTLNQTRNLLDFFSSSSSRPRSRRDIADTLGTVLLSQIFSLINLKIFLSAKIFSLTNPSIIVQTLRDDEGLYFI